jgi:hypothetical protein
MLDNTMPVQHLTDAPTSVNQFDVAAIESPGMVGHISHVGLCAEKLFHLSIRQRFLKLVHMRPPLKTEDLEHPIHSVGSATLNADEMSQIQLFIEELTGEYEAQMVRGRQPWLIRPHHVAEDEEFSFPRFSCAGFVIEAYREANIDLLDTSDDALPLVSLDLLKQVYADSIRQLENPIVRSRFGLNGEGPWPIVLSGYVMHSLSRPSPVIRSELFQASPGNEVF